MKYNLYAGLEGSFGGATYRGTGEFESLASAENMAYEYAIEEYESYAGYHGIREWNEIAEDEGLDPEEDEKEIDELYREEMESWMEYYVVLTEEDNLEEEIIEL